MILTKPIGTSSIRATDSAWGEEEETASRHDRSREFPDHSITVGERLRKIAEAIRAAFFEAAEEGWDGYGARRVHGRAVDYAVEFIGHLPPSVPLPEVAIDVDGDVALEWDYGRRRVLSVRVGRDGTLNYAGLDGYATFYGTEILQENLPVSVSAAIERVTGANRT